MARGGRKPKGWHSKNIPDAPGPKAAARERRRREKIAKRIAAIARKRPAACSCAKVPNLQSSERKILKDWGRAHTVEGNPPAWVVDEPTWEAAKAAVRPYWETYDEPWAVVASVYHKMRREAVR
jgi:hypothetical protein